MSAPEPNVEQLLAELWPDGTFGGRRPVPANPDPAAAEHTRELLDALRGWRLGDKADHPREEAAS